MDSHKTLPLNLFVRHIHFLFEKWASKFTSSKFWEIKAILFLIPLVFATAFPSYYLYYEAQYLEFQIQNFLVPITQNLFVDTHSEKQQFRLFIPFVCQFYHFSFLQLLLIQYFFAALLLYLISKLSFKITGDKFLSLCSMIGFAFCYIGKCGFYDLDWHFDVIAIVFLILSMYTKNILCFAVLLLFSFFIDERAVIASSLIILFKFLDYSANDFKLNDLNKPFSISILLSWIIYFCIRLYLSYYKEFNTYTREIGIQVFKDNYGIMPISIVFIFEGFWILILLFSWNIWKTRPVFFLLLLASMILVLVSAFVVLDVSRSTAYLLPVFFIALKLGFNVELQSFYRKWVFRAMLISILLPTQEFFMNTGKGMSYFFPKIIKVIQL